MLSVFDKTFLKQCGLKKKSSFEKAKKKLLWGTYGKTTPRKFKWIRLIDLKSDHLLAILNTQSQIPDITRLIIRSILSDRGSN